VTDSCRYKKLLGNITHAILGWACATETLQQQLMCEVINHVVQQMCVLLLCVWWARLFIGFSRLIGEVPQRARSTACMAGCMHITPSKTNPKAIKTSLAVLGGRDLRRATVTTSSEFYQPFHVHCVLQPSRATDVPYELRGSTFLVCRRMWNWFPQRLLLGADLLGVVQRDSLYKRVSHGTRKNEWVCPHYIVCCCPPFSTDLQSHSYGIDHATIVIAFQLRRFIWWGTLTSSIGGPRAPATE
jgi:hypothetical protein